MTVKGLLILALLALVLYAAWCAFDDYVRSFQCLLARDAQRIEQASQ